MTKVRIENIFLKLPVPALLIAGIVLFPIGMLLVILIWAPFNLWEFGLGAHSMVVGGFLAPMGLFLIVFGLFLKMYTVQRGLADYDWLSNDYFFTSP
jgi:hypothetical protein